MFEVLEEPEGDPVEVGDVISSISQLVSFPPMRSPNESSEKNDEWLIFIFSDGAETP